MVVCLFFEAPVFHSHFNPVVICASFISLITLAPALQLYAAPAKSGLLLRMMECEGL